MELIKKYNILKIDGENKAIVEDTVISEYSLTIFINGEEIITLLCSPKSLKYLAIGFLYSEGLIKDYSEIDDIRIDEEWGRAYIGLKAQNVPGEKLQLKKTITSGGGKGTMLYDIPGSLKLKQTAALLDISIYEIKKLMAEFSRSSELFYATGGVHVCAICDNSGIIYFEEDIGRHNALDKVLGRALTEDMNLGDKMILTSGRISSEMLAKAVKMGITVIVSRSAPTSSAVHMARELNVILIGFAREEKMNIYSNFSSLKF